MDVQRRRLSLSHKAGAFLDAVRPDPDRARVILFAAAGPDGAAVPVKTPFEVELARSIGGGLELFAAMPEDADEIGLAVDGQQVSVRPTPAEPELFAGLNVALAVRNGERARDIVDWLGYHARLHGLQAALIVDRYGPASGEADDLADALAAAEIPGIERVVLVDPGRPLGKPGLGAEGHRFNAPDAPGRDRMERPEPDPMRAPLGEFVIYELLRHRFLGAARAVMNLDVSDLVEPDDGPSVFDRAVGSPGGVVLLVGQRVFPWSVRKDAVAGFGDHICRRFDAGRGSARWCVAPALLPETAVLRLVRVVGATAPPTGPVGYYRCMGLRHPDEPVGAIVPKTSLIEDPELIRIATEEFGGDPVRAPEEKLKPAAARDTNRTVIITTMKNEGPFILEWLAYHRSIGVEDFLVYTNDCTDGTDEMFDLLQAKGLVQHRENPFREVKMKPQHAALQAAEGEALVREADWVICMDVDEFINIHVGEGTLEELYDAVGDANLISMNWRLYGNSDIHEFKDGFITEQFFRCAPEFIRKPHQAWGFKTLYRNVGLFKKLGVHRPKGLKPQLVGQVNWVNGSGKQLPPEMYRNAWRSNPATYGYDLVTLNHYAVRSAESFLVKRERGRVNHVDRDQGTAYWFRMNNNAEIDRSIARRRPSTRAAHDALMADPEIAAMHARCVAAHRARIDDLMQQSNYRALYDELTSPRMERLSRMHQHFGSGVFLSGPDVIPDEVAEAELTPEFFFTVDQDEQVH